MLQPMVSQRGGRDIVTEQQQTKEGSLTSILSKPLCLLDNIIQQLQWFLKFHFFTTMRFEGIESPQRYISEQVFRILEQVSAHIHQ